MSPWTPRDPASRARLGSRLRRAIGCAIALPGACWAGVAIPEAAAPEYALKAQFLVELLPYVQWRPEPAGSGKPLVIGVLGRSPFGTHLNDYARGRTVRQRPIQIRYGERIQDLAGCDVVFICRSESSGIAGIVAWTRGRRVLTVADDERGAREGVMLCFLMDGQFVRLFANPEAAAAEGLVFSSQLLRIARMPGTSRSAP
ncbi:hypothetical protein GETHPA_21140 [Geothrix rubra]|uniref:YfiR family protein n=1 Tax=Geothrix rubra TaxID=2927977 RepID=A0ABQ5Q837_9BACT|nr:hypothetical protein GETHPA_21140 [Geothrix rubra]